MIPAWGAGRRRAAFHADHRTGALAFVERGGAKPIPITECPALTPALEAAALKLSPIAKACSRRVAAISRCIAWRPKRAWTSRSRARVMPKRWGAKSWKKAAAAAEAAYLARLSVNGEPIVVRAKPLLKMGRAYVAPFPPRARSCSRPRWARKRWASLTMEALAGAKRVIDLFAGIGTFALRAAEFAEVQASESDQDMLNALKAAADGAGGALKDVSILRRDLLRTPPLESGDEALRRRGDRSAPLGRQIADRADRPGAGPEARLRLLRSGQLRARHARADPTMALRSRASRRWTNSAGARMSSLWGRFER